MWGANYFGSLVIGAGLVVTSQAPVPPTSGSVAPYATHAYGTGTFGAGQIVTSQVPVPPTGQSSYAPYATHPYGTGVFGAGMVVTSQTPVPPPPPGSKNPRGYANKGKPFNQSQEETELEELAIILGTIQTL